MERTQPRAGASDILTWPHAETMTMGPQNQTVRSFETVLKTRIRTGYLLHLPAGYEARSAKPWPLILFLHGAGERGTRIGPVGKHGPARIAREQPGFPFVVVSPQCQSGLWWQPEPLLALLDDVTARFNVDPKRIYLTGMSMGGFGTWSLAIEAPERFAAIAPICGGGSSIGLLLAPAHKLAALRRLPVWAFHGALDDLVKLEESEGMVGALRSLGNDAQLTVYAGAGHDSWTETYRNPKLYEWFLRHKNKSRS